MSRQPERLTTPANWPLYSDTLPYPITLMKCCTHYQSVLPFYFIKYIATLLKQCLSRLVLNDVVPTSLIIFQCSLYLKPLTMTFFLNPSSLDFQDAQILIESFLSSQQLFSSVLFEVVFLLYCYLLLYWRSEVLGQLFFSIALNPLVLNTSNMTMIPKFIERVQYI